MTQIRFDSQPTAFGVLTVAAGMVWILLNGGTSWADQVPESVVGIRIEGNETIEADWIRQKIETQPGRQLTARMILADERALRGTRLFSHVQSRIEDSERGPVLVFRVRERPIVRNVRFVGNQKV